MPSQQNKQTINDGRGMAFHGLSRMMASFSETGIQRAEYVAVQCRTQSVKSYRCYPEHEKDTTASDQTET
jgi:hypothetical protein